MAEAAYSALETDTMIQIMLLWL